MDIHPDEIAEPGRGWLARKAERAYEQCRFLNPKPKIVHP